MANFINEGVQGGSLETDIKRWNPLQKDDDDAPTSHHEIEDQNLNPEEALLAKESEAEEPGDNNDVDDDAGYDVNSARTAYDPEEEPEVEA